LFLHQQQNLELPRIQVAGQSGLHNLTEDGRVDSLHLDRSTYDRLLPERRVSPCLLLRRVADQAQVGNLCAGARESLDGHVVATGVGLGLVG